VGFTWFVGLLVRFAHLPPVAAAGVYLLYCAWGGVMLAVVAVIMAGLGRARSGLPPVIVLPVAFVAVEFAFPHVFPWNLAGGQYLFLPFIQGAEVLGVLGLGGLIVAAGAALYELAVARFFSDLQGPARWTSVAVLVLVASSVGLGAARLGAVERLRAEAPAVRVGVVQPNVGMDEKGERALAPNQLRSLQELTALAELSGAQVVVWPESAYPYRIHRSFRSDLKGGRKVREGFAGPVIFGAVSFDVPGRYNSAFLLGPSGRLQGPVDKNHLVLMSERVPLQDRIPEFVERRYPIITAVGFQPGSAPGVLEWEDMRAGILICFEDTIASFARRVVGSGANVLVNLTNDAWFGDTVEPHQHLALSVFRAVENRRDMVRSVNTGVSAVVEATGRVAYETGTFEEAVFVHEVRLLTVNTPYSRAGGWVGWAAMAALVLLVCAATIRRWRAGRAVAPAGSTREDDHDD
jgi:apolipoprotein N-acyltransferase